MLSSTETVLPPSTQPGLYFDPPAFDSSSTTLNSNASRALRRHKNLPHPRASRSSVAYSHADASPLLPVDTTASRSPSGSQLSSPPSRSRRSGGPDLPPTPPAHSRTSSSSHSVLPSSPVCAETPTQSASDLTPSRAPGTPPNQRSPPTPEVTPPRQAPRPKAFRPLLYDRIPSKATTADSRTESFTTAREDPYSSDEDKRSTLRPLAGSRRTSQNTVRQSSNPVQKLPKGVGLGLGLESDDNLTPKTKKEFSIFDGEWPSKVGSGSEVELEWDDNLMRNVTVRKRRPKRELIMDDAKKDKGVEVLEDVTVTPTNATKALRSVPLHDNLRTHSSPLGTPDRAKRLSSAPVVGSPISGDVRRLSGMSSKSAASTIVEAFLVNTPPQRQRTLRHVKKQSGLRESTLQMSPTSSTANSIGLHETLRRHRPRVGVDAARTDSYASSATVNSLASRKARREVWKNGGIPVVVIPDRIASIKSAETPSLRSTSSRRSQRSNSLSSMPLSSQAKAQETKPPTTERPSRRGRAMSLSASDGSAPGDQRTMDYPPMVPLRTSSLSAPTSRGNSRSNSRSNSLSGSRTGSLTADSLKLHNALQAAQEQQTKSQPSPRVVVQQAPSIPDVEYIQAESHHSDQKHLQPVSSLGSHRGRETQEHRSLVDHNGDPFFGKRLTAHNTPFSIASVETNGTHSAAEVSEAMAVTIYPHQNKSVVMVNHLSRAFDGNPLQADVPAGTDESERQVVAAPEKLIINAIGPNGEPVTPPQPDFSLEVDSPLRNPRAPPEPPAIKFTPATPSGLTPAVDKMKMLGNYFETTNVEKRPSLMKRALSLGKSQENGALRPGLLSRTLSLKRNVRKDTAENPDTEDGIDAIRHQYPTIEDPPADESKLHPFWRPASEQFDFDPDDEDWVRDIPGEVDQVYRYPAPDTPRPPPPQRSLSARMKHTFAILPITSDEHYKSAGNRAPERRTIRRTSSGNLRVAPRRDSLSTLRWPGQGRSSSDSPRQRSGEAQQGRPSTAPTGRPGRRAWGVEKRLDSQGRRFFPGWQEKIGQMGIQGLQRRISEKRRQKRSDALRQKISGPREVRDGVGEVIKRNSYKGPSYQTGFVRPAGQAPNVVDGLERAPQVQVQV